MSYTPWCEHWKGSGTNIFSPVTFHSMLWVCMNKAAGLVLLPSHITVWHQTG